MSLRLFEYGGLTAFQLMNDSAKRVFAQAQISQLLNDLNPFLIDRLRLIGLVVKNEGLNVDAQYRSQLAKKLDRRVRLQVALDRAQVRFGYAARAASSVKDMRF